jgi:hypothetical protein
LTVAWTVKASGATFPGIDLDEVTIASAIRYLEARMESSGAQLKIDSSGINSMLEKRISLKAEQITWLQVLAVVADEAGSSIVVDPGGYRLIPINKR